MKKTFDSKLAFEAQKEYCLKNGLPLFVFCRTCSSCKNNIFELDPDTNRGISLEEASTSHITSCPHCNRSFC